MLDYGREICGRLAISSRREWLVTNGIGGFASGTVAGLLTRRYHGMLIAAQHPPVERVLMVTKVEDNAIYDGQVFPLYANHWVGDAVNPMGYQNLERFHLEGTTPVWTYACGDALLEKRVWMEQGANTTYVRYNLIRGAMPLTLESKILVNYRDYHETTQVDFWRMQVDAIDEESRQGLRVLARPEATPFFLLGKDVAWTARHTWYRGFYLSVEAYRGQREHQEDHLNAAEASMTLTPDQSITLVLTTDPNADLDGDAAYERRHSYEESLTRLARLTSMDLDEMVNLSLTPQPDADAIHHLVLAADQFIVERSTPQTPRGHTIIAGYPWFSDWGRDTMIGLPGLTLATGRPQIARSILSTYAQFVDQGMLPNRFPDVGDEPEYNTADATLWYFEAIRAYLAATQDRALIFKLYPILAEIIDWHLRGTRYNIRVDPADGLLYAGAEGVQLTWMDAKVDDWVVTPRKGKPVEINALWYNALYTMQQFSVLVGQDATPYAEAAQACRMGFDRFWNEETGYCFDVLDTPHGHDDRLRPNQLFAVSLHYSPLPPHRQKAVVDACARHLLTSHGLRSLDPRHPDYVSCYGGNQRERDRAYHQGAVWGWLIGPFASAHLRVYRDRKLMRSFLKPLLRQIEDHGVGSLSEIYDGAAPFIPRGCIAQAWTVGEVLRVWQQIGSAKMGK